MIDFETNPTRVQNHEALVVPGLSQTAEYVQGIALAITETELGNLVAARMAR